MPDVTCARRRVAGLMAVSLTALVATVPITANAQTLEQIEIVAAEIVPEHLRPLALTDQEAMIDEWVAHEISQILQNMVDRGAEREAAAASLAASAGDFRDLIETDWYGRLESFPNRDARFGDLTDRDLLDRAADAEASGEVCAQADYMLEFHDRNERARADRLESIQGLQEACGR
ncbi:MAG: hypothetical protein AAFX92_12360 [Pseudomonadota bacterium]